VTSVGVGFDVFVIFALFAVICILFCEMSATKTDIIRKEIEIVMVKSLAKRLRQLDKQIAVAKNKRALCAGKAQVQTIPGADT